MGLFGGSSKSSTTATEQILSNSVAVAGSNLTGATFSVNDPAAATAAAASVSNQINKALKAVEAANAEQAATARQSVQSLETVALSSGRNITELGMGGIDAIQTVAQEALQLNTDLAVQTGLNLADFATTQADIFTENISALKRQELAGDLATAENITKYVVAGFAILAIAFIYRGSK